MLALKHFLKKVEFKELEFQKIGIPANETSTLMQALTDHYTTQTLTMNDCALGDEARSCIFICSITCVGCRYHRNLEG